MKLLHTLYIFSIISTIITTGCSSKEGEETQHEAIHTGNPEAEANKVELNAEQYKVAGIQLGNIVEKNLSGVIKANGVLDVPPQNLVFISAPLGGFVKNTELLQGMKIKKGQIVAVIENAEFIQLQQDYLELKSKLDYMQLEFERQKELNRENVSSAKIFQQTTSEYKILKAKFSAVKEKLDLAGINLNNVEEGKINRLAYITSPINGYVTAVHVNIGKHVTPTDVMFEIVDTDHLHVELIVFEKDIPQIKIGQKIRYTLSDEPSKERIATVYLIGRAINTDRTVRVHAHMDEESKEFLPGMYVNALIETESKKASALPEQAIFRSEGNYFIFILKEKRKEQNQDIFEFEMQPVEVGVTENGFTELKLSANNNFDSNSIVVQGGYGLLSKMKNTEEEGGDHH